MVEGIGFGLAVIGIPSVLALLVAGGQYRAIFFAWLIWIGILFAVFGLDASNFDNVLYGVMTFVFFFSFLAVPLLTMLVRFFMLSGRNSNPQSN